MELELQLSKAIETMDITKFRSQFNSLKDTTCEMEQLRAAIERCLRRKALSFPSLNTTFADVNSFVEFVINISREDICSKTLAIQLLQDIFDVSATNRCEELFGIVEMHIDTWKTSSFFDSCKNMILRMCNDLLKRLSRTIDTTFCGRILILLAKSLPLNEKSGLNLTGQFNTLNVTVYDLEKKDHLDDTQPQTQIDDDMEVGEIRENKDAGGQIPTDHNLYVKFWELQKFFSNPNLLFEIEQFKQFQNGITDIFTVFAVYKLEKPQRQHEHSPSRSKDIVEANGLEEEIKEKVIFADDALSNNEDVYDEFAANSNDRKNQISLTIERTFFAKYLTSQKLFPLQLADSQFRRYFLLQFLIVSNYLTSKIKMKEHYELPTEHESSLKELMDKCYTLLRETYPHGNIFTDSVKKTLNREKQWSVWKGEGCGDMISQLSITEDRKCARRKTNRYDPNITDLGNKELTRLWNIEKSNVQACKNQQRKCMPDLKEFLEEALDEMDPEQQVEEQYQSTNDEKYQWMASRFLLFNSDQYISYMAQEPTLKTPEKNPITIANILRKTIQLTADNIPVLKPRMEQIQSAINKKNARRAEEARLAARTKELERRIKLEEELQQQQQAVITSQIKKEDTNDSEFETTATTSTEVKKEKEEKIEQDHHQPKEKIKEKDSRRAQTPTRKGTTANDLVEKQRSRIEATTIHAVEEKDAIVVPPKKRIKHEEDGIVGAAVNNSSTSSTARSNSSRRERGKESQASTPDHSHQPSSHKGTTTKKPMPIEDGRKINSEELEKDRDGGRKSGGSGRKRHLEKSEERRLNSTNGTGAGKKSTGGGSGSGRSSTDRDHGRGSESERLKKQRK